MDIKRGFDLIKTPKGWKENALLRRKNEKIKITHSRSAGAICAALMAVVIGGAMVSVQRPHNVKTSSAAASSSQQEKADSKTDKNSKSPVSSEEADSLLKGFASENSLKATVRGTIVSTSQNRMLVALDDDETEEMLAEYIVVTFYGDCRNFTYGDNGTKFYTTSDYCSSGNVIEILLDDRSFERWLDTETGEWKYHYSGYNGTATAAAALLDEEPNMRYRVLKEAYENHYHEPISNMTSISYANYYNTNTFGYAAEADDITGNDPLEISIGEVIAAGEVFVPVTVHANLKFEDWDDDFTKMYVSADGKMYYIRCFEDGTDEPSSVSYSTIVREDSTTLEFSLPFYHNYVLPEDFDVTNTQFPYIVRIYDADTDEVLYEIRAGIKLTE